MQVKYYWFILLLALLPSVSYAQGYITTSYIPSSTFHKKNNSDKLGSGDMIRVASEFTLPFYLKRTPDKKIIAWTATFSGSYSHLDNNGLASLMSPEQIMNVGLNISHIRPLAERWTFIASLGAGIYSEPNSIQWRSVLVNGGAIFVYRINKKLQLGLGAGVTTSYGIPMAMPFAYLKFDLKGKYQLKVNLSTKLEVTGISKISDKFNLRLVAVDMDGVSAVIRRDNTTMIYSSSMMRSYIAPELKISKLSTLYVGIGGIWRRTSRLSERKLKSLWKGISSNKDKYRFKPTAYFTIGYRYGF